MKVLVTGGSGFIGGRVVSTIEKEGWTAVGTSGSTVHGLITADVADIASLSALKGFGPFDAVVHCAGIAHRSADVPDSEFERVNVGGAQNISKFAALSGIKHVVLLSSVLVYGRHGFEVDETAPLEPRDRYAASKVKAEEAAAQICSNSGVALTIFRPAPVIGEGCKGNFARLVRAIDRGHFVNFGNGSNRKSMVYVGDVAEAVIRVLASEGRGIERFNIAAGPITTGELLAAVHEALGKRLSKLSLPHAPLRVALNRLASLPLGSTVRSAAGALETWTSEDVYSTKAIADKHGFVARTPLPEAVRRTVAAYKAAARR